jgi:hypothetical protein
VRIIAILRGQTYAGHTPSSSATRLAFASPQRRLVTKVTRRFLRIRFAQGHRRPAAHGDLTDSFVPSLREPPLVNSRSEHPEGQVRTRKEVHMVFTSLVDRRRP